MSADMNKDAVISAEERNRAAIALAEAMGRAREQHAVRDTMRTDARVNAQQRLEMLRLKLTPVFEAIPRDAEQFNLGVVTAEKPRLYVDIIGYVEMTSHLKGYRLMQETRRGVQSLAESNDESGIIAMVTDYIARRLVDRERALAGASPATPLKAVAAPEPVVATPLVPVVAAMPTPIPATSQAASDMQATSDMVASAREALQAAPTVLEEPTRASPIMNAAAQAAEQVKERAASLVETAKQAMSPQMASPQMASPQAVTPQAVTPQVTTRQVTTRQPAPMEATPDAPVPGLWRKAAPAVAATAVAGTGAALSTRSGGGGWVWALLSLLIGIGIGALLLYLYAASLGRP
jgi:hypothetical protein